MTRLFEPFSLGQLRLNNRIVMAPMTRSRAIGNVPNALMADVLRRPRRSRAHHHRRHLALADGLGYARIPGVYQRRAGDGLEGA